MSTSGLLVQYAFGQKQEEDGEIALTSEILPLGSGCSIQIVPTGDHFVFTRQPMVLVRREAAASPQNQGTRATIRLAFEFTIESEDFAAYLHEISQ